MTAPPDSPRRAAAAQAAAARRVAGLERLRAIGLTVLVLVVITGAGQDPRPSLHGSGLAVVLALLLYAGGALLAGRPAAVGPTRGLAVTLVYCLAAVVLALIQGDDVGQLAVCPPVFGAFGRPSRGAAYCIGGVAAGGLALSAAIHSDPGIGGVIADLILVLLMAVTATLLQQARDGQDETELLYAELEDARDAQAEAAAIAERGRIAGELHDVLAHALSGAAIQLQGARRLLQKDPSTAGAAVDRAAELVREGLTEARQAVGALRGDALPTVDALPTLVATLREDLGVDVSYAPPAAAPPRLSPEAGLALYRGAQEAITNAARYAHGGRVRVSLAQEATDAVLRITDTGVADPAASPVLQGGGHGLEAMRERVARAGGRVESGPQDGGGWSVRIAVPVA